MFIKFHAWTWSAISSDHPASHGFADAWWIDSNRSDRFNPKVSLPGVWRYVQVAFDEIPKGHTMSRDDILLRPGAVSLDGERLPLASKLLLLSIPSCNDHERLCKAEIHDFVVDMNSFLHGALSISRFWGDLERSSPNRNLLDNWHRSRESGCHISWWWWKISSFSPKSSHRSLLLWWGLLQIPAPLALVGPSSPSRNFGVDMIQATYQWTGWMKEMNWFLGVQDQTMVFDMILNDSQDSWIPF